jgi:hypothetical protein
MKLKLKMQEIKMEKEMRYGMLMMNMKHEAKVVSSTRYKASQRYHNKSKKIYIKNKQKQCEIGLKFIINARLEYDL